MKLRWQHLILFAGNVVNADLSEGLIAYWPLNGDAGDIIGGHNGQLVGGAKFVQDKDRGWVLSVDGIDGRVEIPDAPELNFQPNDSFTIALWLNIQTLPGRWAGIVTKSRDSGSWYGLWVNPGNQWHFVGGQGGVNVRLDTGAAKTGWLYLVGVYNAEEHTETIYVDGTVVGQNQNVTIAATTPGDMWFGGAKSVSEFLHALMEDVVLYDRALKEEEIQALASGATPGQTPVEPGGKLATTWGRIKR